MSCTQCFSWQKDLKRPLAAWRFELRARFPVRHHFQLPPLRMLKWNNPSNPKCSRTMHYKNDFCQCRWSSYDSPVHVYLVSLLDLLVSSPSGTQCSVQKFKRSEKGLHVSNKWSESASFCTSSFIINLLWIGSHVSANCNHSEHIHRRLFQSLKPQLHWLEAIVKTSGRAKWQRFLFGSSGFDSWGISLPFFPAEFASLLAVWQLSMCKIAAVENYKITNHKSHHLEYNYHAIHESTVQNMPFGCLVF